MSNLNDLFILLFQPSAASETRIQLPGMEVDVSNQLNLQNLSLKFVDNGGRCKKPFNLPN